MIRYLKKSPGESRKKRSIPLAVLVLALVAGIFLTIGGVIAYLSTYTGALTNSFAADAPTDPVISEDPFNGNEKNNVKVDVGRPGYSVYVRAAVVVTWKDSAGNVLGTAPVAGTDYSIDFNTSDWFFRASDGFYYHKKPVAYNGTDDASTLTATLITSCTPKDGRTPAGYGLNVEIIAQTIQALGTTDADDTPAAEEAWGVTIVNGMIQ